MLGAILEIERECRSSLAPCAVTGLLEEYHVQVGTWLARHWELRADLLLALEHYHDREDLQCEGLQRAQVVRPCGELSRFVCGTNQGSIEQLEQLQVFVEAGLVGQPLRALLDSSGLRDPAPAAPCELRGGSGARRARLIHT